MPTYQEVMDDFRDIMSFLSRKKPVTTVTPQTPAQAPQLNGAYGQPTIEDPKTGLGAAGEWFDEYYKNFVKNNSRYFDDLLGGNPATNLNGKTREETMQLSRLADVLNNRVHYKPAMMSAGKAAAGGGGNIQLMEGRQQGTYQMPKVETEETRQAGRMRERESAIFEQSLIQQYIAKGMPLEQARAVAQEYMARANHNYQMKTDDAYKRAYNLYVQYIEKLLMPHAQASYLESMFATKPFFTSMLMPLFSSALVAPDPMKYLDMMGLEQILREAATGNMSTEALARAIGGMNAAHGMANLEGYGAQAVRSGAGMVDTVKNNLPGGNPIVDEARRKGFE